MQLPAAYVKNPAVSGVDLASSASSLAPIISYSPTDSCISQTVHPPGGSRWQPHPCSGQRSWRRPGWTCQSGTDHRSTCKAEQAVAMSHHQHNAPGVLRRARVVCWPNACHDHLQAPCIFSLWQRLKQGMAYKLSSSTTLRVNALSQDITEVGSHASCLPALVGVLVGWVVAGAGVCDGDGHLHPLLAGVATIHLLSVAVAKVLVRAAGDLVAAPA